MDERRRDHEKRRAEEREEEWPSATGGGPQVPGGDAEISNRPGEARERGLTPPPAEPVLPEEVAQADEG